MDPWTPPVAIQLFVPKLLVSPGRKSPSTRAPFLLLSPPACWLCPPVKSKSASRIDAQTMSEEGHDAASVSDRQRSRPRSGGLEGLRAPLREGRPASCAADEQWDPTVRTSRRRTVQSRARAAHAASLLSHRRRHGWPTPRGSRSSGRRRAHNALRCARVRRSWRAGVPGLGCDRRRPLPVPPRHGVRGHR